MCEWRLGRTVLATEDGEPLPLPVEPLTLEEMVAILKRIRKSIRFWRKKEDAAAIWTTSASS